MIQAIQQYADAPETLKFPTLQQREHEEFDTDSLITLRSFYESKVLPEISFQSPNSLKEDRTALTHWERIVGEVDIRDVKRETVQDFRIGLIDRGLRDATVNKIWRELKSIFAFAADEEIQLIRFVPSLSIKMKSKLVAKEQKLRQREIITAQEVSRIWSACKHATYPLPDPYKEPTPKQWKVALVLFWTYGQRTEDVFKLKWKDVRFGSKLIQFEALKTGKLQGLPMTRIVEQHLRSIHRPHTERVFPGFNSRGSFLKNQEYTKRGYYVTWKNEILANAALEETIQFKNFRQRVVTEYNADYDGIKLGSWIAGHSMQGVSAQNYEMPSKTIRKALEAAPVPECFEEIG